MDMNIILLQGNLAADPIIKTYIKDGKEGKLTQIRIINQPRFTSYQNQKSEEEPPEPLSIYGTAFGPTAKYIEKSFKRGSRILIYGVLLPNNYDKDGKKIYSQQLIIKRAYFDGLNRGSQNASNGPASDQAEGTEEAYQPPIPIEEDAFMSVSPEELSSLPFADIQ